MAPQNTVYVGAAFGGLAVVASVAILAYQNRRRRKQRNERPPQETKLLRPPGHFLQVKVEQLNEKWSDTALLLAGAGGSFGVVFVPLIWILVLLLRSHVTLAQALAIGQKPGVLFCAFASIISGMVFVACLKKLHKLSQDFHNHHLGLRGEQAVAEALAEPALAAAGYVTFHDVPGDGDWNIDHVVIGPGGVYVIETKTKSRRKAIRDQQEHIVTFDGRRLQFPWGYDDRAVPQVQANAEWLQRLLSGNGARKLFIQPIIVVPGWYVQLMGTNFDVKTMNATYLVGYLLKEPVRHAPEELQCARELLNARCRTVEF